MCESGCARVADGLAHFDAYDRNYIHVRKLLFLVNRMSNMHWGFSRDVLDGGNCDVAYRCHDFIDMCMDVDISKK